MNNQYQQPVRRRRKPKYRNIAFILATLLLIIVFICASCTKKDDGIKDDTNDGSVTPNNPVTDNQPPIDFPPLDDIQEPPVNPTKDPTNQESYTFDAVDKTQADLGEGTLVLVNNNIKFLGSVNEDELVIVHDAMDKQKYWVSDRNVKLLPRTMDALNSMLTDFYSVTGKKNMMARSGYRSIEYQQNLYDDELKKTGASTSTLVAKPGFSEHQTGYVVDFTTYDGKDYSDFDGTGDFAWIMENCHKYGFINRYPEGKEKLTFIDNEPWHFRYVGVPHATLMKQYGYCLEEYIAFVKSFTIDTSFLLVDTPDGAQYIIYYTPLSFSETTAVYLPQMPDGKTLYPYEISGNNVDGFIVTVQLKAPPAPAPEVPEGAAPENQDDATDESDPQ